MHAGQILKLNSMEESPAPEVLKMDPAEEKRLRRQTANSNERRRMQRVNAGFSALRNLLGHNEREQISKAAVLEQTAEFIQKLIEEKERLVGYNQQLQQMIDAGESPSAGGATGIPVNTAKRRKTEDGALESADEGTGSMFPGRSAADEEILVLRRETMELKQALELERRHRVSMEEHIMAMRRQQQEPEQVYSTVQIKQESGSIQPNVDQAADPISLLCVAALMGSNEVRRCHAVRNNPERIVEAISRLDGGRLFADNSPSPTSPPPISARARNLYNVAGSVGSSSDSQAGGEWPMAVAPKISSNCQAVAVPTGSTFVVSPTLGVAGHPTSTSNTEHQMNNNINAVSRTVEVGNQSVKVENHRLSSSEQQLRQNFISTDPGLVHRF